MSRSGMRGRGSQDSARLLRRRREVPHSERGFAGGQSGFAGSARGGRERRARFAKDLSAHAAQFIVSGREKIAAGVARREGIEKNWLRVHFGTDALAQIFAEHRIGGES